MKRYLLVDFENLPKVDLDGLPEDVYVPFFFGASQRTVSKDFLKTALRLGPRFMPIDIEGQGKNALDFHIAFYLGECLARDATAECVILSRDKGFDPLVRHLVGRGLRVRRVGALTDAFGARAPQEPSAAARTVRAARRSSAVPGGETPRSGVRRVTRAATSRDAAAPSPPESTSPSPIEVDNLRAMFARAPRHRPRKRKGLVAVIDSFLGRRASPAQIDALVQSLIDSGCVSERDGVLSWHFG